jgi:hypothetical protein
VVKPAQLRQLLVVDGDPVVGRRERGSGGRGDPASAARR